MFQLGAMKTKAVRVLTSPCGFYQTFVCGGEAVWDRDDVVSDLLFLFSNLQVDIGDSKTSKRN